MGWWGVLYGVSVLSGDVVGGVAGDADPPVWDWVVLVEPRAPLDHVGPRPTTRTGDGPKGPLIRPGAGRAGVGAGVGLYVTGE